MKVFLLLISFLFLHNTHSQKPTVVVPTGHNAWVTDLAASGNGLYFATSSYDNTIKIWDLKKGKELITLYGHSTVVNTVDFSSDGTMVASGDFDGNVFIWSVKTKSVIGRYKHEFTVNDIAFSPGDSVVGSVSSDRLLLLYSLKNKAVVDIGYTNHHGLKLEFSSNGKTIVVLDNNYDGENRQLLFYDRSIRNWVPEKNFYYRHGDIVDFALSKDGTFSYTITDTDSGHIRIHKNGGVDTLRFNGHTVTPQLISASDSSHIIYTLAVHDTKANFPFTYLHELKKWDLRKKKCVDSIQFPGYPSHKILMQFVPQEKTLLTNTGNLRYIETQPLQVKDSLVSHTKLLTSAHPLNNGQWMTVNERGIISIFDLLDANIIQKTIKPSTTFLAATAQLSKDSSSVYSLTGNDHVILRSELASGTTEPFLKLDTATRNFKISRNENYIAYFYKARRNEINKRLNIVDLKTSKTVIDTITQQISNPPLECYDFSPDDKTFFFTNWLNDTIHIIDLLSHERRYIKHGNSLPEGYLPIAIQIKAINDSLLMSSYYKSNELVLWNFRTGKEHSRQMFPDMQIIDFKADLASNTMFIYSNDGKVLLAGLPSLRILTSLPTFNSSVALAGFTHKPDEIFTYSLDNVMRFWDAKSSRLLYSYVAIDSSDFVLLRPDGYYRSTQPASKLLYYGTPDLKLITFEQLDVKYNRPDLVLKSVGSPDTTLITSYEKAYQKRITKLGVDTTSFGESFGLPRTEIANERKITTVQKQQQLKLHIRSVDSSYKLDRFNIWVNEVPLFGMKGISLRKRNTRHFDTTLTIQLSQGNNLVETSVTNMNGTESYRMPLQVRYVPAIPKKEKVFFIGIGINRFAEPGHVLQWSVKDIRDLAANLKKKYGNNITIDTLFDENVTVENVLALKKKLMKSSIDDKVIISYSGHGLLSNSFDYYLSTYSVNFANPEKGGLPYEALENLMDRIPARKKLMLIDACHSGEVDKEEMEKYVMIEKSLEDSGTKSSRKPVPKDGKVGMKNSFELMQELFVNVGRTTGATVISAAAGTQFAQEQSSLQNGVFTYSILEYMQKNKTATVSELRRYVNKRVVELTGGLQVPTARSETRATDWAVW